jgi:fumarate reductase flavoprotein subunit
MEKYCDLLVLGGGGGGLTAAVRVADITDRKVIILEKAGYLGGGAIQAGGFAFHNSNYQKERGLPDHLQEALIQAMDETLWLLDRDLVYRSFLASGAFFDWHLTFAPDVKDCYGMGGPVVGPEMPMYNGKHGGRGGTYVMKLLIAKAKELGVDVMLKSKVVDVEVENGKITAAMAETPEGKVKIHCRACVLATGSWINNKKFMKKVYPEFAQVDPGPLKQGGHRSSTYTGDGFAIAKKIRAFIDYDGLAVNVGGPMTIAPCETLATMCIHPYSLEINLEGKRWACEPSIQRANSGYQLARQPECSTYVMCDRNTIRQAAVHPDDMPRMGFGPMAPKMKFPTDIDADLEMAVTGKSKGPVMPGVGAIGAPGSEDDGLPPVVGRPLYYAETLDDMARVMEVPAEALKATITHYNECCKNGFDDDFFKAKKYLVPLTGPYYAVKSTAGSDGAFGGVKVNANMQAYAEDGGLVEGFYVVGDFASGRFINIHSEKKQIMHDLTWAFSSGFIAGESIAAYLNSA